MLAYIQTFYRMFSFNFGLMKDSTKLYLLKPVSMAFAFIQDQFYEKAKKSGVHIEFFFFFFKI